MSDTQTINKQCVSARRRQLTKEVVGELVFYVQKKADTARLRGTKRCIIDELLVSLLLYTGIRLTELCRLNVGDFSISDEKAPSIMVRGDSPRSLSIPFDLFEKLQKYVSYYRDEVTSESPLLATERGTRISSQTVYLKIKSIGNKAGLKELHPYMIRHYYLCELYQRERDLKLVQKIGGYQDTKSAAMSLNLDL